MIKIKNHIDFDDTYLYKIYGLIVKSNFFIPTLELSFHEGKEELDVQVIYDKERNIVPMDIKKKCLEGGDESHSYHGVRRVGEFYVVEGNTIYIEKSDKSTMERVAAFLLGKVFGIILRQRGSIALHGSSVLINGKANLFIGKSQSGKSTLAAGLRQKGYKFIGDEVEVLKVNKAGKPLSVPSYPCNRLSKYAIDNLGIKVQGELDEEKMHYLKVESDCCSEPQPLGAIFEIQEKDVDKVEIQEVFGQDKVEFFFRHNYMRGYITDIPVTKDYFKACMTIVKATPMYIIKRPKDKFTVFEQMKLVEEKCF